MRKVMRFTFYLVLLVGFLGISISVWGSEKGSKERKCNSHRVIWVDVTNVSGMENGTRRYPFDTITEGINKAKEGQKVKVRPGIYYESIYLKRGVKVKGFGPGRTIIDGQSPYWYERVINHLVAAIEDSAVLDTFQTKAPKWQKRGPIYKNIAVVTAFEGGELSKVTVRKGLGGGRSWGVYIKDCSPVIKHCDITQNYCGIEITGRGTPVIRHSRIFYNQENGISVNGSSYARIVKNKIFSNLNNGITVIGAEQLNSPFIWGNEIRYNYHGIHVKQTKTRIRRNKLERNRVCGIYVDACTYSLIEQNEIVENYHFGVYSSPEKIRDYLLGRDGVLESPGTRFPTLNNNTIYYNRVEDVVDCDY